MCEEKRRREENAYLGRKRKRKYMMKEGRKEGYTLLFYGKCQSCLPLSLSLSGRKEGGYIMMKCLYACVWPGEEEKEGRVERAFWCRDGTFHA